MRRLTAGLACFGVLWALAGCADPARDAGPAGGQAATTTTGAGRSQAAPVKQRDTHLSGRQLNLAVYYLRTFRGRRYLNPEWHPVRYTRAVAAAAVTELLDGDPYCPGARRPFAARCRCSRGRRQGESMRTLAVFAMTGLLASVQPAASQSTGAGGWSESAPWWSTTPVSATGRSRATCSCRSISSSRSWATC